MTRHSAVMVFSVVVIYVVIGLATAVHSLQRHRGLFRAIATGIFWLPLKILSAFVEDVL